MITNRIRAMRKRRGLTLQELAERIRPQPTTPQTIGRLETGARTVSLDWLLKLAEALDCHIADLLDMPERPSVPLVGSVAADGRITGRESGETVDFEPRAGHPVAVRLAANIAGFQAGDVLIGDRLDGADLSGALGRPCIVEIVDGQTLLRIVVQGARPGCYGLVPLRPGPPVRYEAELAWAAPLMVQIRELA